MIGISASLAACLCFWNVCANVHCVNACVCFEANKYSSSRPTSSGGRCRDAVWHAGKLLWVQAALDGAVQSYDLFTVIRKVNSVESRQCRPAAWFICCGVRAETAITRVTWHQHCIDHWLVLHGSLYHSRGTRPLQLWRQWGPSVFGPV